MKNRRRSGNDDFLLKNGVGSILEKDLTYLTQQEKFEKVLKKFSDFKNSIRGNFLFPKKYKNVDEYVNKTALNCPYTAQTEITMKSQCYSNRIKGNKRLI